MVPSFSLKMPLIFLSLAHWKGYDWQGWGLNVKAKSRSLTAISVETVKQNHNEWADIMHEHRQWMNFKIQKINKYCTSNVLCKSLFYFLCLKTQ